MSEEEQKASTPNVSANERSEVEIGLTQFYSSLAATALAQYDNISHLLGQTSDWTAPGMACEVLIRQVIRSVLPTQFSVDKGFIHGRYMLEGGKSRHSPEIDILIHDSLHYAPLLRIDDFVIVQPAAVRGMVQVKRTMTSGTLAKALENIVDAKRHIRDCMGNVPRSVQLEDVFSAFITFRDEIADPKSGGVSATYENRIKEHFQEFRDCYIAPHFVGSLDRRVFGFTGLNLKQMGYVAYRCVHTATDGQQQHMGLQVFLSLLAKTILPWGCRPPFSFPAEYIAEDHFLLFKAETAEEQAAVSDTAAPEATATDGAACASAVEAHKPAE